MKNLFYLLILTLTVESVSAQVVNNSLGSQISRIFPELRQGYIDLNRNGTKEELGELNETIPESRVKDSTIQVQEVIDYLKVNYKYIPLEKLEAFHQSIAEASGPIGELIALSYTGTMANILDQKRAIGDQLFLTPSAYKEAMAKMGKHITNMSQAFQIEGKDLESSYLESRQSLLDMISQGYPFPQNLNAEEILVVENSMITLISKADRSSEKEISSALQVLGILKAESSVPYIQPLTENPDFFSQSIYSLGKIGGPQARNILTTHLNTVGKVKETVLVLNALGQVADAEDIEEILPILKPKDGSDPHEDVEKAALKALSAIAARGISDPRLPTILEGYLTAVNPELRMGAIRGLGIIEGTRAEQRLLPLLKTEKDEQVIIELIKSLQQGGGKSTTRTFLAMLNTNNITPPVRAEIIRSLGDSPQGVQALNYIVADLGTEDPMINNAAQNALLNLYTNNTGAVTATLTRSMLRPTSDKAQEEIAKLLAQLADPASIPSILQTLKTAQGTVKEPLTWAVYKIAPENNVVLLSILQNLVTSEAEPLTVRINAIRAIGKIGMDTHQLNLWQTLVTAAKMRGDKYYSMRIYAIEALGALGDRREEVISLVLRLATKDRDRVIQLTALQALALLGTASPDTELALESLFSKESDNEIQLSILLALSDMDSPSASLLAPDFFSTEASVSQKRQLIYSLTRMGTRSALKACLNAAKDPALGVFITQIVADANPQVLGPLVADLSKSASDSSVIDVLEQVQEALDSKF